MELIVQRVVAGGLGLAFHEGEAVFIPYTAPGDRILAEPVPGSRRARRARMTALLEPGPGRVEPPCPLFGECGGCQLQHLDPVCTAQVKTGLVEEALRRLGRLSSIPPIDWQGAEQQWGYRWRAGLKVRWVGERALVGFHAAASHRLVDLPGCPVLHPGLAALIEPIRAMVAASAQRDALPQVDVMRGGTGVGAVVHYLTAPGRAEREKLQAFAERQGLAQLWVQFGRKQTLQPLVQRGPLSYGVEGHELGFRPGDFTQAHGEQNRRLVALAMAAAGRGARAVDLFCGIGNFTLPLADRFQTVLGVEGYAPALAMARQNAPHLEWQHADLTDSDALPWRALQQAEVVVMDPPREGAMVVAKALASLKQAPPRIVYISCDPATLARDAALLQTYQLTRVTAVEMFPQTAHVETVAVFEHRGFT